MVNSDFHTSEVNELSTRDSFGLNDLKQLPPRGGFALGRPSEDAFPKLVQTFLSFTMTVRNKTYFNEIP